jgi:excisionase family DNA binding protein
MTTSESHTAPRRDKATLTIAEAASVLGIGRNSAYAAARQGQLPTVRMGKRLLVPIARLEKMLGGGTGNGGGL